MQRQDLDRFVLEVDAFDGVGIVVFVVIVTALSLRESVGFNRLKSCLKKRLKMS